MANNRELLDVLHSKKCDIKTVETDCGGEKETRYVVLFSLTNTELQTLRSTFERSASNVESYFTTARKEAKL